MTKGFSQFTSQQLGAGTLARTGANASTSHSCGRSAQFTRAPLDQQISGRYIDSSLLRIGIPPSSRTTFCAFSVKTKSMNLRAAVVTVASR